MNILIYGSKGWIGNQFLEILKQNDINFFQGKARVDNENDLLKEILNIKPTHIISFIGRTHGSIDNKYYSTIDYLEQPNKLVDNIRDNLYSPLILSFICKNNNIHLTYLGTGCIFNYDNLHPYAKEENGFNESDNPNFFGSSYSIVKGFTDRIMKQFSDNVLNLRIRMPIIDNENPRNFITKILRYEKICNIPNSMTVLPELLPLILDMQKRKITGTLNFTNPGLISHNEILDMYKEIIDPTFEYKNFNLEEQRKVLASDRSNNYLDTTKLEQLYPNIKNIKDSVRNVLLKYKLNCSLDFKKLNSTEIDKIKCLFVTGGCGFIGSNFINSFHKKHPTIKLINFDALYYCSKIDNINKEIQESPNYKFIEGNLQSYDLLKYIFENNEITHIIHFAAQSHVDTSFSTPIQYTKDNIVGTHNLLEINRLFNKNLIKFIVISTDEVYGESMIDINEKKKTEQSILCPTNPYAATKASAELIAQSYNHSFNMPIVITRGNNVYGPNQYEEKLIPKLLKLLKENKKLTIHGDGSSIRSFLHVNDTVSAVELILEKGKIGEIYNIGGDNDMEYNVLDVAKKLIKEIKNTENYNDHIEYVEDRLYNDKRYYINNNKLKELGWKILIKFDDGLKELILS